MQVVFFIFQARILVRFKSHLYAFKPYNKQCIIVTKSYLYKDDHDSFAVDDKGIKKLQSIKHIPIYRIQKLEGFDKKDQSTIETIVTPLF